MSKFNMTVQAVDAAGERRKKTVKAVGFSCLAVMVLMSGGFLAWYLTAPPLPTTLDEAIALAKSPRYKRLSDEKKQPYLDVIREQFGSLDREQRRAMIGEDEDARDMARDAMRAMMMQMVKNYGAASYEQRQAMAERMPGRRGGPPGGEGRGDGGGRGGRDAGQMRNRVSDRMANGNAQAMGTLGLMIQDRRAKREESR